MTPGEGPAPEKYMAGPGNQEVSFDYPTQSSFS